MRLSETEEGKSYKLADMHLLGKRVATRVRDMGLVNCHFKVITRQNNGPILVEVRGTRLALGKGISEKINAEEIK